MFATSASLIKLVKIGSLKRVHQATSEVGWRLDIKVGAGLIDQAIGTSDAKGGRGARGVVAQAAHDTRRHVAAKSLIARKRRSFDTDD